MHLNLNLRHHRIVSDVSASWAWLQTTTSLCRSHLYLLLSGRSQLLFDFLYAHMIWCIALWVMLLMKIQVYQKSLPFHKHPNICTEIGNNNVKTIFDGKEINRLAWSLSSVHSIKCSLYFWIFMTSANTSMSSFLRNMTNKEN